MDDNLAIVVVLGIAVIGALVLIVTMRWMKDTRAAALLTQNKQLTAEVGNLTERLATLERIATDPGARVAREIEQLR